MAIDPIQFQGFTERQGFAPIKAPDPSRFLREDLSVLDASLTNLERGSLRNMKEKADAYSRNLAQLSDFSQTLQGFLGSAAEIYDKKQEAAANALYYKDLKQQEMDIALFEEGERLLQEGDGVASRAALAADRQGAPYTVSKRIAELGGLQGHYYRLKAVQDIAGKYDEFIEKARQEDDREITFGPNGQYKVRLNKAEPTELEQAVILATLNEEYMTKFAGINQGMLAKYAFPVMRQIDERLATLNSDRISIRDSERERAGAIERFVQSVETDPGAFQTLLNTFSRTTVRNSDGKVVSLRFGGAWKQIQNHLIEQAKVGNYIDIEAMVKDQVNPETNKKYMDDPVFSTKIKAIQIEMRKAEAEKYRTDESNGQVQFQKALNEVVSQLPDTPTDSAYEHAYTELRKVAQSLNVVPDFTKLNDHRANYSQSAVEIKHKMAYYRERQKAGLLNPDDISREPPEIQKAFLESAQQQQQLQENERGYKLVDEKLKSLIVHNPIIKAAPDETGTAAPFMLNHVKTLHRARTNELLGTEEYNDKPYEASLLAYQELEKEVLAGRDNEGSIYYINKDGYVNFLNKKLGTNANLAANRRIQLITKLAKNEGKGLLENEKSLSSVIDRDTIIRAAEGWGKPGYRMDPAIRYLAGMLELSPLNVVHRARDTFGLPEIPALTELAAKAENANPDLRRTITRITEGYISKNQLLRNSGSRDLPVRPAFSSVQSTSGDLGLIDSSDHPYFVSIGVNEGTRIYNGGYTKNWEGHTDPGDGHNNRGTVSGGRGNPNQTPQQVDDQWKATLRSEQLKYQSYVSKYAPVGSDLYKHIMFNILDLRVQAPLAVPDFVKRIPQLVAEGVTPEVIGRLRAESFINPRTGRLEASGFNNNMQRLQADQTRRAGNFKITGGS